MSARRLAGQKAAAELENFARLPNIDPEKVQAAKRTFADWESAATESLEQLDQRVTSEMGEATLIAVAGRPRKATTPSESLPRRQTLSMASIDRFTSTEASRERLAEIRRLLLLAFGGRFSDEDWQHTVGGWHSVAVEDGRVVAHAAVVPRVIHVAERPFRAGYVEAVATAPVRQGTGLGSQVMGDVGRLLHEEFEMGALSTGRHDFYGRLGWERWRGPTFVRYGSGLVRTEDEDDGIMVMRFGPSSDIDLVVAISCEARPGDDW